MAKDILQRISRNEISKLLKVLEIDMPYSAPLRNWIRVHQAWESKVPGITADILCPGGDWSNRTVVALCRGLMLQGKVYGLVYCTGAPRGVAQLENALRHTSRVPWDQVALFTNVLDSFAGVLRDVVPTKTTNKPVEKIFNLFHFPAEKAAQLRPQDLGPGVRVCQLDGRHVDAVCQLWPYFAECYRPAIAAMVAHNLSAGVFVARADGGGEDLVSMALEADYGGLGMAQTVPEHQGRGYGSLVVAHLAREMGRAGISPYFTVLPSNNASIKLLHKRLD